MAAFRDDDLLLRVGELLLGEKTGYRLGELIALCKRSLANCHSEIDEDMDGVENEVESSREAESSSCRLGVDGAAFLGLRFDFLDFFFFLDLCFLR